LAAIAVCRDASGFRHHHAARDARVQVIVNDLEAGSLQALIQVGQHVVRRQATISAERLETRTGPRHVSIVALFNSDA
jgi:hypothetical protein